MKEIYLPDQAFHTLAEKIANLEPCPFAGRLTADQVKIVLSESDEIWPEGIRE